jgi:hypothetical protein
MWERNSRVSGSMTWNSSSMPRVNWFLTGVAFFEDTLAAVDIRRRLRGFKDRGLGIEVEGLRFRAYGLRLGVYGLGLGHIYKAWMAWKR